LGIPDWEKVNALARALINLNGLSVSNEEARNIQALYRALDAFDKNPLTFIPCPQPATSQRRLGDPKKATQLLSR